MFVDALEYQSSVNPSQTQGQWLKNINESLGLAPQYKIKAGLRPKHNFASQLQRKKMFGLSASNSQRNLGGLHSDNPLTQYGLADGQRQNKYMDTTHVAREADSSRRILDNTARARAGQLTQSEQKSVFDRNIFSKRTNLQQPFAHKTTTLTRVNSDLGSNIGVRYHLMKERKMSDNPRRPIP